MKNEASTTEARTIKTVAHAYQFYINTPDGKAGYEALREKLTAQGLDCFESHGGNMHYAGGLEGKAIELETAHLFENQWNTTDGMRVFDWAQDYMPYRNPHLKQGHWLEQTEEMRQAREEKTVCGYCGAQYWRVEKPGEFCARCLDSEYLKESDLHLLRLLPASTRNSKRAALTSTERAIVLPQYVSRQTTGTDSRAVQRKLKTRERVEAKFKSETASASMEYRGMTWLLDRDVNIENCIYYSHTEMFSFGWRSPVSASVKSALLDVLCDFPFAYEIKAEEGQNFKTRS